MTHMAHTTQAEFSGSYVMTVSSNGQVSIPASTRSRWRTSKVVVVDMGDRIVMRPLSADPIAELRGKYAGRGPSTDEMRAQARAEDLEAEERKYG